MQRVNERAKAGTLMDNTNLQTHDLRRWAIATEEGTMARAIIYAFTTPALVLTWLLRCHSSRNQWTRTKKRALGRLFLFAILPLPSTLLAHIATMLTSEASMHSRPPPIHRSPHFGVHVKTEFDSSNGQPTGPSSHPGLTLPRAWPPPPLVSRHRAHIPGPSPPAETTPGTPAGVVLVSMKDATGGMAWTLKI